MPTKAKSKPSTKQKAYKGSSKSTQPTDFMGLIAQSALNNLGSGIIPSYTLPFNFSPRDYQHEFFWMMDRVDGLAVKRAVLVWHRRAGKDKCCLNYMVKEAYMRKGSYFYFFPTYSQGRKILWDGMDRDGFKFLDHIPEWARERVNSTEMKIILTNGSLIQVIGSDNIDSIVGTNPIGCIFSEYALQDPSGWDYVRPILRENGGWAIFPYTPRGKNHGYSLYAMAKQNPAEWYCSLLTVNDTGLMSPQDVADEIRQGMDADLAEQEFYCCPPGTMIWTDTGQRPIESVQINDTILSHAGRWRKVKKLYSRVYNGELIEIISAGSCEPLLCTPNHPVYTCDPSTQTYKWVNAGEIKPGDNIVLPRLKLTDNKVISCELAELIAWFIAEGSVSKNHVQFSLNKSEQIFAERICNIASNFGKATIHETETTLTVTICSCWLADFLIMNCGSGAVNKHIPWNLISGHEEIVYQTLIDGDGCRGNYSGPEEVFTTISYSLAQDVQMLANMIGKRALVNKRPAEKVSNTILGRICNISDSYSVRISKNIKKKYGKQKLQPQKHGVAAEVTKVSKQQYHGFVYNFAVQYDESYIAEGRIVHNCSFEAALQGAYYHTQISDARREGRICKVPYQPGVPVDTWWDLGYDDSMSIWFSQDIGREIHLIHYLEGSGEGFAFYVDKLANLRAERKWNYGRHTGPHDMDHHEISSGKSRKETMKEMGLDFNVAPRPKYKEDAIEQCRNIFPRCYFDEAGTVRGVDCLASYQKEWNEKNKVFMNHPKHNWASHGADAFSTLALAHKFTVSKDGSEGRGWHPNRRIRRF